MEQFTFDRFNTFTINNLKQLFWSHFYHKLWLGQALLISYKIALLQMHF